MNEITRAINCLCVSLRFEPSNILTSLDSVLNSLSDRSCQTPFMLAALAAEQVNESSFARLA